MLSNWFYDKYMVLNPEKCHFLLFGVKENEQFVLIYSDITLKHSSHKIILGVTTDNKLSSDEHINNIHKIANKKFNARSRINHYIKIIAILQLLSPYFEVLLQTMCKFSYDRSLQVPEWTSPDM